jgi:Integrase core domain.
VGYLEIDMVVHCGSSTLGEYINTLSTTEISSGWWEGEAIMSKSQEHSFWALKEIRKRTPFAWKGIDSDNGPEFINQILYKYCQREKLEFTRSRPNRKNDNAYIEQKNWTHVRKIFGYLRYDTYEELAIMKDLYHNELRLYKNFFQPVMKLASKERIGGKVKGNMMFLRHRIRD